MANYNPPKGGNIYFKFGSSGYQAPDFLDFSFISTFKGISDFQATIEATEFYTISTKTFVKSCRKIVVGYNEQGIQVLNLPCLYGGLRDLSSYIVGMLSTVYSSYQDLSALISVYVVNYTNLQANIKVGNSGHYDLHTYSKSIYKSYSEFTGKLNIFNYTNFLANISGYASEYKDLKIRILVPGKGIKDLYSTIQSYHYTTLLSTILAVNSSSSDLRARILIPGRSVYDLSTFLRAVSSSTSSLSSVIRTAYKDTAYFQTNLNINQPIILPAFINIIDFTDFYSSIYGEYFKDSADLSITFGKVTFRTNRNLDSIIHGWDFRFLGATIGTNHAFNLQANIFAGNYGIIRNLSAILSCIAPINLSAAIHGYDIKNLEVATNVSYQPNDLPLFINCIYPQYLLAYIYGLQASNVRYDLKSYILCKQTFARRLLAALRPLTRFLCCVLYFM